MIDINTIMRMIITTIMVIAMTIIIDTTCRRAAVSAVQFEQVDSAEHEGLLQSRGLGAVAAGSPHHPTPP